MPAFPPPLPCALRATFSTAKLPASPPPLRRLCSPPLSSLACLHTPLMAFAYPLLMADGTPPLAAAFLTSPLLTATSPPPRTISAALRFPFLTANRARLQSPPSCTTSAALGHPPFLTANSPPPLTAAAALRFPFLTATRPPPPETLALPPSSLLSSQMATCAPSRTTAHRRLRALISLLVNATRCELPLLRICALAPT